jgi:hypothetical protein
MDKFLEKNRLPKMTQAEIHNASYSLFIKIIEFCSQKFFLSSPPPHKNPSIPDNVTGNFYQIVKKNKNAHPTILARNILALIMGGQLYS